VAERVWRFPASRLSPCGRLQWLVQFQSGIFLGTPEMRTIEGIAALQPRGPALFEQVTFFQAHACLARLALIVAQQRGGLHDHFVAGLSRPQAQVHVIVIYRKRFIEAAQLIENFRADCQTGRRSRR